MKIEDSIAGRILEQLRDSPEWMERGNCVTTESDVDPSAKRDADAMMELCRTCPVLAECSSYYEQIELNRADNDGMSISHTVAHQRNYRGR